LRQGPYLVGMEPNMINRSFEQQDRSFEQLDARYLRNALGKYPTGVAVITTRTPDGKLEGLTANSFAGVSLEPPLILWSLRQQAPSLKSFLEAKAFAVNVLGREQADLSRHFSRPSEDKFCDVDYSDGFGGCPVLPKALAVFECSTEVTTNGGDHIIFLGRVRNVAFRDGHPLIFSGGKYCTHAELAA
jgi:flavin reductase (DIM6/NTAB) family NADH-FMN oxidoreductase RutF